MIDDRNEILADLQFKPVDKNYRDMPVRIVTALPEVKWRVVDTAPRPKFWRRLRWRMQAAMDAWRDAA